MLLIDKLPLQQHKFSLKLICLIILGIFSLTQTSYAVSTDTCFDTDTKLMLHMNGTDGSTTFTDSSTSAHTMTANGNAQIDTGQSKFGGASGQFDGTGDYVSTPDSADWTLSNGNFTIDAWVRFNSVVTVQAFVQDGNEASENAWLFYFDTTAISFFVYNTGFIVQNTWSPSTNTWYHVAITRSGNTWRTFVDGVQVGSDVTNTITLSDNTGTLTVGGQNAGASSLNGWLDELRLVKGTTIWTANFTPPSAEYVTCGANKSRSLLGVGE